MIFKTASSLPSPSVSIKALEYTYARNRFIHKNGTVTSNKVDDSLKIFDKGGEATDIQRYYKELLGVEHMEQRMAEIDKEFAQLPPLEKDCIVYRGRAENPIIKRNNGDFKIMDNAKVGDVVIPDTAYSYTAFHYDMANNWCQCLSI